MNTTEPTEPAPRQLHGESDGPGCPVSAMRPVDPDRHEKSREARDAAWKKHEPNWRFRAPPLTFIVAWNAALDHAAQEQPAPPAATTLPSPSESHLYEWVCQKCGQRGIPATHVTFTETHDGNCGGDVVAELIQPAEPTQSAREWVRKKLFQATDLKVWAIHMEDALKLADRADAAEAQEKQARDGWRAAEIALDAWMAKLRNEQGLRLIALVERDDLRAQLAAAQDETRRLREALDNLCVAVAGAGVRHPKERELLQECYDAARAALAAQKEGEES